MGKHPLAKNKTMSEKNPCSEFFYIETMLYQLIKTVTEFHVIFYFL